MGEDVRGICQCSLKTSFWIISLLVYTAWRIRDLETYLFAADVENAKWCNANVEPKTWWNRKSFCLTVFIVHL